MQITILADNTAGGAFLAEHGLSFLIHFKGLNLLLDTGHSNVFMQNAKKQNIDLQKDINMIILSHGHWDHGDGLKHLKGKPLITHPQSFIKRYRKGETQNIGLQESCENLKERFNLILSDKPFKITDNIFFLGSIPRENDFEAQTTAFVDENNNPDFVPDDSALAFVQNNEIIVVTGCSHSGICNIIEHAKKVTGVQTVSTVIGGFHLKQNNTQTQKTIEYFKNQNIKNIYPCHCTALPALAAFHQAFNTEQVKTGMMINV